MIAAEVQILTTEIRTAHAMPREVIEAKLSGKRVLVTGAAGFIGTALTDALLAAGSEVTGTSRSPRPVPPQWSNASLAEIDEVRDLFDQTRPEVVYHLAGEVSAVPDLELVVDTFESHLTSTVNVLTASSERNVGRVVLGASVTEPVGAEEVASSPYAAAKAGASLYGRMFHALYDLQIVLARIFMAYGPGQRPTKLIPCAAASLIEGRPPQLSSGRVEADWIFIDDVVDGLIRAAVLPGLGGQTVDLGSGHLVTMREVIEEVVRRVGGDVAPAFGALPDRPREREVSANVDATGQSLAGWRPTVTLNEGIRRTVEATRKRLDQA